MERVADPLLDTLDRVHASMLLQVQAVVAGEVDKRALDAVGAQLRALAAAEKDVLYPAAQKIALRFETRQFLDDAREYRAAQLDALAELTRTRRSARLFAQRAQYLCELVVRDAAQFAIQLIAVLRSQLPRAFYGAIARAFVMRLSSAPELTT